MVRVIEFPKPPETEVLTPNQVLQTAIDDDSYSSVLVLGWDKNGEIDARSTLDLGAANLILLMQHFQFRIHRGDYMADG